MCSERMRALSVYKEIDFSSISIKHPPTQPDQKEIIFLKFNRCRPIPNLLDIDHFFFLFCNIDHQFVKYQMMIHFNQLIQEHESYSLRPINANMIG